MLPKVATHILHSTVTRSAAAAVQKRNVLQLHPSTPGSSSSSSPSTSAFHGSSIANATAVASVLATTSSSSVSASGAKANAHGGSHGPNSGGPGKDRAGSRFYTGYNGAARAVTQANALTTQDTSSTQLEESEEVHPAARRALLKKSAAPKRTRLRSSSVNSLLARDKDRSKGRSLLVEEKAGVLKTVQLQARSFHVLTASQQQTSQNQSSSIKPAEEEALDVPPTPLVTLEQVVSLKEAQTLEARPSPVRPRRNSTSSPASIPSSPLVHSSEIPLPASPFASPSYAAPAQNVDDMTTATPSSSSSSSSESWGESDVMTTPDLPSPTSAFGWKLEEAIGEGDVTAIISIAKQMISLPLDSPVELKVGDFNKAIEAIGASRDSNEPLHLTLEVYNAMLRRSIHPNFRTYVLLIEQFTTRDLDVQRALFHLNHAPLKDGTNVPAKIAQLKAENNFMSALKLFEAIIAIGGNPRIPYATYKWLMRSCAAHGNVQAALKVLGHLENRNRYPDPDLYRFLMQTFANSNDYKGAELVFEKYRRKEDAGELFGNDSVVLEKMKAHMWNQMIQLYFSKGEPEKAIGLLDLMLKAAPSILAEGRDAATTTRGPAGIPGPTSATFTAIIDGFIQMDDVSSALLWFNRLLEQENRPSDDPLGAIDRGLPSQPDKVACVLMRRALAKENRIDDINDIYRKTMSWPLAPIPEMMLVHENLKSLSKVSQEVRSERLDLLKGAFLNSRQWDQKDHAAYITVARCMEYGLWDEAMTLVKEVVEGWLMKNEVTIGEMKNFMVSVMENIRSTMRAKEQEGETVDWPFGSLVTLARVCMGVGLEFPADHGLWLLHAYGRAKNAGEVGQLPVEMWELLLKASVEMYKASYPSPRDFGFQGIASLLEDMAASGVRLTECAEEPRRKAMELASQAGNVEWSRQFFGRLGESYLAEFELAVKAKFDEVKSKLEEVEQPEQWIIDEAPPHVTRGFALQVHNQLSGNIEKILRSNKMLPIHKADTAYAHFDAALSKESRVPHVSALAKLMQLCGRLNQMDRVRELYNVGLAMISQAKGTMLETNRCFMWVTLEDHMIIALAHGGDFEGAHEHRRRILTFARQVQLPYKPSADAYGALILHVKDTTDDATNAMILWEEALEVGVQPNLYLYNNIISKLSRARKVDQALELFYQIKAGGAIVPSSITYGAVIGACVRVGDAVSAEALFKEMTEQPNFNARIPPFNTMMQMYTTTRPDRERAVWYYNEMLRLGIAPTGHTYKLLLDVYSIDSVDKEALQRVWKQLLADEGVQVNGAHFASLINAYGCVLKDMNQAVAVFESIPREYGIARDAVVYEALVSALVANKRTDLIREYMERMMADGVHMTAYVANLLIKGYANAGDVEQARVIFESMVDPATGVAAPNNHAPHVPVEGSAVGVLEPVYREPSTWEAMIRGELGAGNRDRAYALLERLRTRQFPDAVFNRISGVLVDHSMPIHV